MQYEKPYQFACLIVIGLALTGCQPSPPGQASDPPAATQPAPSPAPPPEAARATYAEQAMEEMGGSPERDTTPVDTTIDGVKLSNEGDTEQGTLGIPRTRFAPTDSVFAEITSNGTASEYTIYAKWIDTEGNVLTDYGIRINEPGPKRTVISLSKPDGWSTGRNRIELAVNGKTLRTITFDVQ